MEDIKIIKSVEDSGLLLKGVTETVQNNVKEPKWGFLNTLLDTLGASLLRNILAGKGINRAIEGREIKRADYVCHSLNSSKNKRGRKNNYGFLIPPHPLTNFEIPKCYRNEPRFNGVYSRDNLPKIKNGAYVINLDEYSVIGTHWVTLYVMNNNVTYFDSFGVEHIPKEIKAFIDRSLSITNIFRIQAYNSIMCRYFCIGFIGFVLAGKTLTEFTNLFSPNNC